MNIGFAFTYKTEDSAETRAEKQQQVLDAMDGSFGEDERSNSELVPSLSCGCQPSFVEIRVKSILARVHHIKNVCPYHDRKLSDLDKTGVIFGLEALP